jgi:hypothetical protein
MFDVCSKRNMTHPVARVKRVSVTPCVNQNEASAGWDAGRRRSPAPSGRRCSSSSACPGLQRARRREGEGALGPGPLVRSSWTPELLIDAAMVAAPRRLAPRRGTGAEGVGTRPRSFLCLWRLRLFGSLLSATNSGVTHKCADGASVSWMRLIFCFGPARSHASCTWPGSISDHKARIHQNTAYAVRIATPTTSISQCWRRIPILTRPGKP